MGFDTRDRHLQDVEDDVDVDGEDDALYGVAQFSEGDILTAEFPRPQSDDSGVHVDEEVDVDVEMDTLGSESIREKSLKDLVTAGKLASKGQADTSSLTGLQKIITDVTVENSVRLPLTVFQWASLITSTGFSVAPTTLSHLHRPICRTNGVDRLLAYVLQRMLATLPRFHQALPHMQEDHLCNGITTNILVVWLFLFGFYLLYVLL